MMCSKLKKGMLLTISNSDRRGWFHFKSHSRYVKKYGKNVPPKFVIGPETISLIMRLDGISDFVKPGDVCVYLGTEKVVSREGKTKTLRLVLVNGQIGFIEGKDIKHLEPL